MDLPEEAELARARAELAATTLLAKAEAAAARELDMDVVAAAALGLKFGFEWLLSSNRRLSWSEWPTVLVVVTVAVPVRVAGWNLGTARAVARAGPAGPE